MKNTFCRHNKEKVNSVFAGLSKFNWLRTARQKELIVDKHYHTHEPCGWKNIGEKGQIDQFLFLGHQSKIHIMIDFGSKKFSTKLLTGSAISNQTTSFIGRVNKPYLAYWHLQLFVGDLSDRLCSARCHLPFTAVESVLYSNIAV